MRVFQLLELPELLEADALYFILNGDYAESYLTDDNGVAKFIGNTSMIESLAAGGAATVAELTDATTYDFPTLNTPVAYALAAKADSTDLGSIATFEGDQNLRTTDSPTFNTLSLTTGGGWSLTDGGFLNCLKFSQGADFRLALNSVYGTLIPLTKGIGWANSSQSAPDTTITRLGPGSIQVPNLTASGTVTAADVTATGTVTGATGSFTATTTASSPTTGALVVGGGIGCTNLNAAIITAQTTLNSLSGTSSINQVQLGTATNIGILWAGKSRILCPSNGEVEVWNNAISAYSNFKAANITASGTVTGGAATFASLTATTGPIRSTFNGNALECAPFGPVGSAFSVYGFRMRSLGDIQWGASSTTAPGTPDTSINRQSAGVVGIGTLQGTANGSLSLANLTASGTVTTGAYTVATLPTPSTGMRAYVTDSNRAAHSHFGSAVIAAGGGTEYIVPVFYDGTDWIIA